MSRMMFALGTTAALLTTTAGAEVPQVATDIVPVHSLVATVMKGVGTPDLIISQGASPHEYNLRPSEARALQEADLVFWIGKGLTPWMDDAIDTLAEEATVIELHETTGIDRLAFREGALFEAHDHGEEHPHEDGDETQHHDDHHDDEEHEEHAHDKDHEDHHSGHDHGAFDPHLWLSPQNAAVWLNAIAAALSAADPDNAGTYYANASAGRSDLSALSDEINALLDPVRGKSFVVFHDAYQYFETAFDFPASGAIALSDATDPSPARVAEIQSRVTNEGINCVLSEPQFNQNMVTTVMEGSKAKTAILDPLGSDIALGPDLYSELMRTLASNLAECL